MDSEDGSANVVCTIECLDGAFPCCSETLVEYDGLVLEDLIGDDDQVQPGVLQVTFPKDEPEIVDLPPPEAMDAPPPEAMDAPPPSPPPEAMDAPPQSPPPEGMDAPPQSPPPEGMVAPPPSPLPEAMDVPPPSPQAPDSPTLEEKNEYDGTSIGTSTEEEPDWLRLPMSFPSRPPVNTTVMWKGEVDLVIRGVLPPDQIRTLARQTTNVLTIDEKLVRVFLMRGGVRVGPLSLDLASWDADAMTYNASAKDTVRSLAPFRLRAEEGSVVRFHRARREAFNRR